MPDARSLPAPDHFSTMKKMAGTKKIPITLAAIIPPITVVPMICRATAPAPLAVHSGTQPRMNAKRRHQNWPQAKPGSFERGVRQGLSLFVLVFGKFNNQNRVLCRQPDEHDQSNLRVDIGFDLDEVRRHENTEQHAP